MPPIPRPALVAAEGQDGLRRLRELLVGGAGGQLLNRRLRCARQFRGFGLPLVLGQLPGQAATSEATASAAATIIFIECSCTDRSIYRAAGEGSSFFGRNGRA
jgi:hypothetical protein